MAAILEVNQAEVQLGLSRPLELLERRKVLVVLPSARNGHVQPVERAAQARREGVCHTHEEASVGGLFEVVASEIPVAQVVAHLDVGRYSLADTHQPLDDVSKWVGKMRRR